MHDPPYSVKNIQNNLLSYDVITDGKTVSLKHTGQLYELQSKSVLRFVPKLTKSPKMKNKSQKRLSNKTVTQFEEPVKQKIGFRIGSLTIEKVRSLKIIYLSSMAC